jgi:hypothetical protein
MITSNTNYHIIHVNSVFSYKKALEQLEREVNEAMALGWEPVGGVAVAGATYFQAMIKRR